jgi:hypothetical protein
MSCGAVWYRSPASHAEMIINLTTLAEETASIETPCKCENPGCGIRVQLIELPSAKEVDQMIGESFAVEGSIEGSQAQRAGGGDLRQQQPITHDQARAEILGEQHKRIARDYAGYQYRGQHVTAAGGHEMPGRGEEKI